MHTRSLRPSVHRRCVLAERASSMRHAPTASEVVLFEAVRDGQPGVRFCRQVPLLGRYIADLLVPELRLVVEVDGGCHAKRAAADARRDRALARAGYNVLRLQADLVMHHLPAALALIRAQIAQMRQDSEPVH